MLQVKRDLIRDVNRFESYHYQSIDYIAMTFRELVSNQNYIGVQSKGLVYCMDSFNAHVSEETMRYIRKKMKNEDGEIGGEISQIKISDQINNSLGCLSTHFQTYIDLYRDGNAALMNGMLFQYRLTKDGNLTLYIARPHNKDDLNTVNLSSYKSLKTRIS